MHVPSLPMTTERLTLRGLTRGDLDAVYAYRSREDVSRYLCERVMTRQDCLDTLIEATTALRFAAPGDRLITGIVRRDTGKLIGEMVLTWCPSDNGQGEIGYLLHPDHTGLGFATEAAEVMLQVGFDGLKLHRISARCDARNSASVAVMRRLGMAQEAHLRETRLAHGLWSDDLVFALLEREWRSGREHAAPRALTAVHSWNNADA